MAMSLTTSAMPRLAIPARAAGARAPQGRAVAVQPRAFLKNFFNRSSSPVPPRAAAPPAPSPPSAADPTSLFARLGGADPVYAVTSSLFDRLLADETLGHFFDPTTLGKHKKIVATFLNGALGGPSEYKGRSMFDAHIGLVELEHPRDFTIVATHLGAVMEDLGVPADLAAEVMGVVGTLEPEFAKISKARKLIAEMD